MNVLLNDIKVGEIQQRQNRQYQEALYLSDTVPAGATRLARVGVSNLGPFFLQHITASYTTESTALLPVDDGIDYLRGQLIDSGTGMRPLFNDFIPFDLWATPGRRKSLAAGNDSFQMQVIFPFEYLFPVNGDIILNVKNDSDVANSYSVAFWGVRILAKA